MMFPKQGRIRLKGAEYLKLQEQVFTRDGWRCRRCRAPHNLQMHHLVKRSRLRRDTMENCCTLCNNCHEQVERHRIDIIGGNADVPLPHPDALRFVPHKDRHE